MMHGVACVHCSWFMARSGVTRQQLYSQQYQLCQRVNDAGMERGHLVIVHVPVCLANAMLHSVSVVAQWCVHSAVRQHSQSLQRSQLVKYTGREVGQLIVVQVPVAQPYRLCVSTTSEGWQAKSRRQHSQSYQ